MAEEFPSPAQSAGSFLQRIREEKGITLDEASKVTRIGKNYLTDIEADRFDKLPNPAYVKGFLRNYAGFLGVPAEEVLRLYDRSQEQEHPEEQAEPVAQRRKAQPVAYVVVAAVVLLAGIGYMIGQKEEQITDPPAAHKEIVPVPAPVQPVMTSAVRKPAVESVAAPVEKEVSPAGASVGKGVFLRLKVNEDTKLFMNIDGSVTQEYALNAGDLIEWKGENFFIIDLDDPAGVEAELNGRKLAPLGPAGRPVHLVLRRDGVAPGTQEQGEN